MTLVAGILLAASAIVIGWLAHDRRPFHSSLPGRAAVAVAAVLNPSWDRQLLASGTYMYARYVPRPISISSPRLKAGTLVYYREGAAATVSVKRLTGTLSLAIDGKTDASNRSDMLTQSRRRAPAAPAACKSESRSFIIGMGSGVYCWVPRRATRWNQWTCPRSYLRSSTPSQLLRCRESWRPRSTAPRVIVGDGRTHLQMGRRRRPCDRSEPSNPWIAGVAALFTREFFGGGARPPGARRRHLSVGETSTTSAIADLRRLPPPSRRYFPTAAVWFDWRDTTLPFVAPRLSRSPGVSNWLQRGFIGADMSESPQTRRASAAVEPFSLLSLFAGGPAELFALWERAGAIF